MRFPWNLNFRLKVYFRMFKLVQVQSHGSTEIPNQNLRQIGPGVYEFSSDRQTEITTSNIFIYLIHTGLAA